MMSVGDTAGGGQTRDGMLRLFTRLSLIQSQLNFGMGPVPVPVHLIYK